MSNINLCMFIYMYVPIGMYSIRKRYTQIMFHVTSFHFLLSSLTCNLELNINFEFVFQHQF
jgi:hypothetical protein